jgi:hypothetical protein
MLLAIVGGRFGSASEREPYSISQMEIKHAIECNLQVYIFVEADVWSEYKIYIGQNKSSNYRLINVDNLEIFNFIEELEKFSSLITIQQFKTAQSITLLPLRN